MDKRNIRFYLFCKSYPGFLFKKKIKENQNLVTKASYLGLLKHGNTYKLTQDLENMIF